MGNKVITDVHFEGEEQIYVSVKYSDGSIDKNLIKYYSDELSFSKNDFLGKTRDEAKALFRKRDTEYLRS